MTAGPDLTFNGSTDAFVAKVSASGYALVYCTYIGGSGVDVGSSIAVDSAGHAYLTGHTTSSQATFRLTLGPSAAYKGGMDVFVAKLNPSGSQLLSAGYSGGSSDEAGRGIAVDTAGNAYTTGYTHSTEASFPVAGGPDLTHNGSSDASCRESQLSG